MKEKDLLMNGMEKMKESPESGHGEPEVLPLEFQRMQKCTKKRKWQIESDEIWQPLFIGDEMGGKRFARI